jgi:tRNA pseudouridine38-40 synthase
VSRYFLQLSYFGKHFNGWQVQQNTKATIQGVVQENLSILLRQTTEVVGCGRTDTGVHAKSYFAHFDSEVQDLAKEKKQWLYKLNKISPPDIAFHELVKVNETASARFDALTRTYEYHIHQQKNVFLNDFSWYTNLQLNIEKMNEAAHLLLQFDDFTSFSKLHTQNKTNICKIKHAKWEKQNDNLVFTITANRFLRNMVRSIVGTLIDVGTEKISISQFIEIIEAKNRNKAGMSVPAHGLFLTDIHYPSTIFIHEQQH